MGCTGLRLGRNFPRENCQKPTEEELWTPNPRIVSERFMARKPGGFIPATTLNLLAAAWIQFQTHDWFNHEIVRYNAPVNPHCCKTNHIACFRRKTNLIFRYLLTTPGPDIR
jgi:hypothetical protein